LEEESLDKEVISLLPMIAWVVKVSMMGVGLKPREHVLAHHPLRSSSCSSTSPKLGLQINEEISPEGKPSKGDKRT